MAEKRHDTKQESSLGATPRAGETTGSIQGHNRFKQLGHWVFSHKKISIPVVMVLLLAILAAVPLTRYAIAGLFMQQTFPVVVIDKETGKPVSSAVISLNGTKTETDNKGRADVRTNVGHAELEVTKKYYKSFSQKTVVPLQKPNHSLEVSLKAQGRPVPVAVVNIISKRPVVNATIAGEGTEAKTDSKGKATLVVPADKKDVVVTVSGKNFNNTKAKLTVTTDEMKANTFTLTPGGQIYFLSNASGTIDLIKSNLDGSDRQTALAGTGKEDRSNTVLLASRDWKYIALLSKRDGGEYPKLFLVETETGKVTTMDEGEATFSVYGWSDDRFIYVANRAKRNGWDAGRQALKSYHAPSKKITTLAETAAEGDQNNYTYERFGDGNVYVLGEEVVFTKNWNGGCGVNHFGYYTCFGVPKTQGKQATLNSVHADGSQKKVVKSYANQYIGARTAEFGEIYVLFDQNNEQKVDEYHSGKIETVNQDGNDFYDEQYPYYSVSPSGNAIFLSKHVDGKNTFLVGDSKGGNGKEIGRSAEYTVYGWFTDSYVLLTKKNSEMYIMSAADSEGGIEKSLKITDYYKPDYSSRGFGYGYGG